VSIEGRYANYLRVGNNAVEFVLDFGQQVADDTTPEVVIRVFTTPVSVKEFLRVLGESVSSYEAAFGPIELLRISAERD
jgi:hypothetical protein